MTHTRAMHAPWAGLDAHSAGVVECPEHRWVTHRVDEVVFVIEATDARVTFCARCYVPRCEVTYRVSAAPSSFGTFPAAVLPCARPLRHRHEHAFWTPAGQWLKVAQDKEATA